MGSSRQMVLRVCCALAALGASALVPGSAAAQDGRKWGADYFPNVVVTSQDGAKLRFYEDLVKGKSVAFNIIYTSCVDECPLETARLAEVQRLLGGRVGKDVFFYSITIDPARDTPKVLKAYSEKFGVEPGWLFLTGKKEDIRVLTRKLGLSRTSDAFNKDGHASSLMLGNDRTGQWMRASAVDNPRFLVSTMAGFFGWSELQATQGYEAATVVDISKSQFLFQSRCSSCHTIGGGDRIGPDLQDVTRRREKTWLARYLKEPERVRAEGDPTALALFRKYREVPMPNLALGQDDVAGMLAWLERQDRSRETRAAVEPGKGQPARAGLAPSQPHHHPQHQAPTR